MMRLLTSPPIAVHRRTSPLLALLALGGSPAAGAQSLREQVAAVRAGVVTMSFAAREGVCGHGRSFVTFEHGSRDRYWESDCEPGPARVVVEMGDGRVQRVTTYLGGRWREVDARVTRLGTVSASEAASYFLGLIETADPEVAKQAILPARLADSTDVWPRLLGIARDRSRPSELRKRLLVWVAAAAGERAVQGLAAIVDDADEDRDVRESAVFALSRLPDEQAIPRLIALAREHPDPAVRKRAIFWLGRKDDPRALQLFEEILLGAERRQ